MSFIKSRNQEQGKREGGGMREKERKEEGGGREREEERKSAPCLRSEPHTVRAKPRKCFFVLHIEPEPVGAHWFRLLKRETPRGWRVELAGEGNSQLGRGTPRGEELQREGNSKGRGTPTGRELPGRANSQKRELLGEGNSQGRGTPRQSEIRGVGHPLMSKTLTQILI